MAKQSPFVVGTDFSVPARIAVARADALAHACDRPLLVVHAVPPEAEAEAFLLSADSLSVPDRAALRALRDAQVVRVERAGAALEDVLQSLEAEASGVIVQDRAGEALVEVARKRKAYLVVAGVHRAKDRVEDFFLGSTAEQILRTSRSPVLLVRHAGRGPYEKVLVPLDMSDVSLRVLMVARTLAPRAGLVIVRFLPVQKLRFRWERSVLSRAEHELAELVRAARIDSDDCELHVLQRDPREGILAHAELRKVDLIAMGTGQKRGLQRLMVGSVAEYVMRAARCDVLSVPPAP
jgi:nucleotide-binding universal stress UspA family protein